MKAALEILRVVDTWITDGNQFTCYDVTRQVRDNGFTLDHQDTRTLVHGLHEKQLGPFEDSDYDRFTTSFTTKDGRRDTAEVYRSSVDSDSYDPDWLDEDDDDDDSNVTIVNITPATPQAKGKGACGLCGDPSNHRRNATPPVSSAPSSVSSSANNNVQTSAKKYRVDNRGRICVRQDLIKSLSLVYTDRIFLHELNGDLILTGGELQQLQNEEKYLGTLMVDKNRNVRISRHLQEKAGIKAVEFNMTSDGNKVVVSA